MDLRFPPDEDVLTVELLARRARETPDRVYLVFEDGEEWTYGRAATEAWQVGNALRDLGVREGDFVSVWFPGGKEGVRLYLGVLTAGGVYSPLNLAYQATLLEHALNVTGSSLLIGHADLIPKLEGLEIPALSAIVALGPGRERLSTVNGITVDTTNELRGSPEQPQLDQPRKPWDPMCLMFTSGTTGPSKGVLQSYYFYEVFCEGTIVMTADDRFFGNAPTFHNGWPLILHGVLRVGGSVFITDGFSARTFWDHTRTFGITACYLVGTMANMLLKNPPQDNDKDHPLRALNLSPNVKQNEEFAARFNLLPTSGYGSTEVGLSFTTAPGERDAETCGRARPGYEMRIVDADDNEAPHGEVGELMMRHRLPWVLNSGYKGMGDATAAMWRNGWLHTGDAFKRNEEGNFFFIDRMKDVIRRRGENISSMEIEVEVLRHEAVAQVGAFAVRDEHDDEEVMIVVRLKPETELTHEQLTEFLITRLAHYMVPRYIDIVEEMPMTATVRVQKNVLRQRGVTPTTWDRVEAGIVLRRQTLAKS